MSSPYAISTSAGAIASSCPSLPVPSLGQAITVRLSWDNYFLWKAQVTPVLRAQQLFGLVDGSAKAPSQFITEGTGKSARQVPNPEYLHWFTQDQIVVNALVSSMNEDMLGQMTQFTTATPSRKKDMTAAAHFQKMKGLADTMASIGNPLTDEEVLGYMLAGLGSEYESLFAFVTARDDPLSLHSFYGQLISVELRYDRNTSEGEIQPSTNAAACSSAGDHGRGRGRGRAGPSRGRGNFFKPGGRGNKPTCQVCDKYGHDALRCRNGFNHAYRPPEDNRDRAANAANTSYTVDPNSYTDNGATDHLTSDLDHKNVRDRYNGKDIVQVANGSGLPISHIGHSVLPGLSRPLYLRNILHVPNISKNLLSVHKLAADNDAFLEFHPDFFCVKDQATGTPLLHGRSHHGLYPVPCSSLRSLQSRHHGLASVTASSDLWHKLLGHPSSSIVESIVRSNKIVCAPRSKSLVCDSCQPTKVHQNLLIIHLMLPPHHLNSSILMFGEQR